MALGIRKSAAGHHPDKRVDSRSFLDSLRGEPAAFREAMSELRRGTIESILRTARKPGEQVVKVAAVVDNKPQAGKVKGYATFLSCLKGSGIAELEIKLGFAKGALAHGAYIYTVDPLSLNLSNIVPEGYTDWSDGVTPRELHTLSQKHGVEVTYDPRYPASPSRIIQFRIVEEVPCIAMPRFVKQSETV